MLKSNSKYTKARIADYIRWCFDNLDYENWPEIKRKDFPTHESRCRFIIKVIDQEMNGRDFETFKEWTNGLPALLDCCYYFYDIAKEWLKDWLDETDEEAAKFSDDQAIELVNKLLYREIYRFIK